MQPTTSALLALVVSWVSVSSAWGLEFMADQITRINGHSHKASVLYRDDMWRLEHSDAGPVNVTIVRKDKQVMWFLLARMKHFKTLPYDPEQAPKVRERLEGESAREVVGTEILEGHPTTLYEVTTKEQGKDVTYYQWLATDIHFPLRLARKDGSWTVEYRNVKLRALPASLFQIPLSYLPLEEWERVKHDGPSKLPM